MIPCQHFPSIMKFFALVLGNLFFAFVAFSQTKVNRVNRIIKGIVLDSIKNAPLSNLTITLQEASPNSQAVKNTLTKENGEFELPAISGKSYILIVSSVGYQSKSLHLKPLDDDLGSILLSPTNNQLSEVIVKGSRPTVMQEVDRLSYNVQNDPMNESSTVLDMLRKVPLVSVNAAGNIKLKGSENFKILINGKESALIAQNPSDVFKGMPASNINKIEVITTPPSKYDAEGLAGILNIITKKNIAQGYKGSVSTRFNSVEGEGINVNATLKQGKLGVGGFIGFNNTIKQTTGFENSNSISRPIVFNVLQQGLNSKSGDRIYGSAELSYEIDTLNLITGSFQSFNGNTNQSSNQYSSGFESDNKKLAQYYHLQNSESLNNTGIDMGINYQLSFKNKKDKLLTASYKYLSSLNDQSINVDYLENTDYAAIDFKQLDNSGKKEQTVQLDYVQTINGFAIESGTKAIFRTNFSDFKTLGQSVNSTDYNLENSQSNSFSLHQNIYSLYNSYQYKSKQWIGKVGVRLEATKIAADFISTERFTNPDYNNLIPSFSIQRVLNPTNNLTFGYTDRIRRPTIRHLNPFVNQSNPKFLTVGNPNLKPVVNHTVELNYSNFKKGSVNISLNYSFANNTIENMLSVGPDTVTTSTFQNIGKNKRLGLDFDTDYPITEKMNLTINAQILNVWLTGTRNGQNFDNRGLQGHLFIDNTYSFDKGLNVGFNVGYESRFILLQGKDNNFFSYTLNGSKEILKKKATIALEVSNLFKKYRTIDFYNRSPDFSQANSAQTLFREFALSFNYKFGKLKGGVKKNKRGISNDDAAGVRN